MHRIALVLLLIGIVASLGVANAYNGFALGSYNDGFASGGPAGPADTAANGPPRAGVVRGAVDKTYRGASETIRDWSDVLGRYAPWMADFEISAGLAARHASNVTNLLKQNSHTYTGHEYSRGNGYGRPGCSSPAPGDYSIWSGGSSGGSSGSGSSPYRHLAALPYLSSANGGDSGDDSGYQALSPSPLIPYVEVPTVEYVPAKQTVTELIPVVLAENDALAPTQDGDTPIANPEPCTLLLGGLGLAGMALAGRRARGRKP